jgi:hypothetical protein
MSPPTYKFDGYTFRPAVWADLTLARAWNAADPDHSWELEYPYFWIEQTERVASYVLEDAVGVVFFLKALRHPGRAAEITLQFDRDWDMVSARRVVKGLCTGFEWLKKALPMNGFRAVYFLSKNQQLIAFAVKVLGFVADGERYTYDLGGNDDGGKVDSIGGQKDEGEGHQGSLRQSHG